MTKQFENPEEEEVDNETADDITPKEREEREAEKLARKSTKRTQEFEKENHVISK